MVNTAAADFLNSENKDYYEGFYAKSLRDQGKTFEDHIKGIYLNLGLMSASSQTDYEVTVTCDNTTPFCQKEYFAHINDGKKTMNLCDIWFDNSKVCRYRGRHYRLPILNPNFQIAERLPVDEM